MSITDNDEKQEKDPVGKTLRLSSANVSSSLGGGAMQRKIVGAKRTVVVKKKRRRVAIDKNKTVDVNSEKADLSSQVFKVGNKSQKDAKQNSSKKHQSHNSVKKRLTVEELERRAKALESVQEWNKIEQEKLEEEAKLRSRLEKERRNDQLVAKVVEEEIVEEENIQDSSDEAEIEVFEADVAKDNDIQTGKEAEVQLKVSDEAESSDSIEPPIAKEQVFKEKNSDVEKNALGKKQVKSNQKNIEIVSSEVVSENKDARKKSKHNRKVASGFDEGLGKNTKKAGGRDRRFDGSRARGKVSIDNINYEEDDYWKAPSLAAMRRRKEKERQKKQNLDSSTRLVREVKIPDIITVRELAVRMSERVSSVLKLLVSKGEVMRTDDVIDSDLAEIIALDLGHKVKRVSEADVEDQLANFNDDSIKLLPRPPVVTVMGHVDHGKTTLLDALRGADVAASEVGGVTQHIGAYQVDFEGKVVTVIDTPGHAAFSAMRERGATVTDIVILVVAADDGVMPQTIEAIKHAKTSNVPIVVAINKIDKPGADPDKARNLLMQHDILVESLGGDCIDVEISALKKINLEGLIEAVLLQAELMELKGNLERPGEGVVLESKMIRGRGLMVTVLVQYGQLKKTDIVVAGIAKGRIRSMVDHLGNEVKDVSVSQAVGVFGLSGTIEAGDKLMVVESESRARELIAYRKRNKNAARFLSRGKRVSMEEIAHRLRDGTEIKYIDVLVKADVHGSIEAISGVVKEVGNDEVMARVIHSGLGDITESDINTAASMGAMIVGFNVRVLNKLEDMAAGLGVKIVHHKLIYDLIDDLKQRLSELLTPERRYTFLGRAEVLDIFDVSTVGKIMGCRISDGVMRKGGVVKLLRGGKELSEGTITTLKRFKDDAREAVAGHECGVGVAKFSGAEIGDTIECYLVEEIKRVLK